MRTFYEARDGLSTTSVITSHGRYTLRAARAYTLDFTTSSVCRSRYLDSAILMHALAVAANWSTHTALELLPKMHALRWWTPLMADVRNMCDTTPQGASGCTNVVV